MTNVLVLRALGLGDALTGVAALRGVRRAWPGARVVLAAPAALGRWLVALDVVDDVLPTDGVAAVPDRLDWSGSGHVAVNLHGRGPASHRALAATGPERLVAFGCPEAGHEGPPWRDDEHEVDRWCRLVTDAGGACSREDLRLLPPALTPALSGRVLDAIHPPASPGTPVLAGAGPGTAGVGAAAAPSARARRSPRWVVVHPGAASGSRRWPAERWGAVVGSLPDDVAVLVTGTAGEAGLCDAVVTASVGRAVSLAGELTLPQLAALVAHADLLLCGDTGVAHVGTAFGTPSVLLFGPTAPSTWGPAVDLERHVVLWHGDGTGDPHGTAVDPALEAVTVGEVTDAAHRLLRCAQPGALAATPGR